MPHTPRTSMRSRSRREARSRPPRIDLPIVPSPRAQDPALRTRSNRDTRAGTLGHLTTKDSRSRRTDAQHHRAVGTGSENAKPYAEVPSFATHVHGTRVQITGLPRQACGCSTATTSTTRSRNDDLARLPGMSRRCNESRQSSRLHRRDGRPIASGDPVGRTTTCLHERSGDGWM